MQNDITSKISSRLRISVAIATYNGAKFFEQQLISILSQELLPDEIIICDDASTDDSRDIIMAFASKHKNLIRYVLNDENIGYTKNFEKAISLTTGDIVFFSDQDDVWYDNKIKFICGLFEQNPCIAGITHDGRLVDHALAWYGTTKSSQITRGYGSNHNVITGALSAIRSAYLDIFLPIPVGVVGHDTWLTYIFSLFRDHWLQSVVCLQDIRRYSGNTSEWVVNSFRPVNRFSVLRSELSSAVAPGYNNRRLMNEALEKRLREGVACTKLFSIKEVSIALCYLRDELDAIRTRESIVGTRSRIKRSKASLSFWAKGGYKYFNGLKSLARDMLR